MDIKDADVTSPSNEDDQSVASVPAALNSL